jgi:hypothetical protein
MEAEKTLQQYFVENRSRLIDIAAYLDRIGRAKNFDQVKTDFRWLAFQKALAVLLSEDPNRVELIQDILSDPTQEPHESAGGVDGKSAWGAFKDKTKIGKIAKVECC